MRLTTKQRQILNILIRANSDGTFCDLDQLLERISDEFYETTKASMQFSIRALIQHGLIRKDSPALRRGRRRVVLVPTAACYELMSA